MQEVAIRLRKMAVGHLKTERRRTGERGAALRIIGQGDRKYDAKDTSNSVEKQRT